MENRAVTKNVTIEGREYQVTKVDARTACWLFTFMGARSGEGAILSGLGKCTRQEFDEVQALALSKVFFLDEQGGNTFPITVIAPDGSFTDKRLASDAEAVMRLTTESLLFNLSPFLVERGSNSQA